MVVRPDDSTQRRHEKTEEVRQASGPASLVLFYGGPLGQRFPLEGEVVLGRDDACAVPLAHAEVSRRHARLREAEGRWVLEDLGSTNGTFVNGLEVIVPQPLFNGDLVKVGGVVLKYLEGGNLEALYFEEIHRLAITDGLTGVPNRRFLLESLEREIARAQRYARPLTLVMLDVDRFKVVNDTYGHVVGDVVLQTIAGLASQITRTEELFVRYGGEEFTFVLPETDLARAMVFCERVRTAVAEAVIPVEEGSLRVTVSLGAAQLEAGMDLTGLIAAADAQLYRAKASGRNRVLCALVP